MQALHTNPTDEATIEQNRSGRLTAAQRQRLLRRSPNGRPLVWACLAMTSLAIFAALLAPARLHAIAIRGMNLCIALSFFVVPVAALFWNTRAEVLRGEVTSVRGVLDSVNYLRWSDQVNDRARVSLHIGRVRVHCFDDLARWAVHLKGKRVRVFVLPRSKRVVSVEIERETVS